ncbi:hypothetical protein ACFQI7_21515 [Paenibacillus allorhizosphaerae]|uniref:Uncharacterized protein n=1 Tax=Paenibacillus allorhizosphaerae TaxID=2849866 RepID=A0ABM8VN68_9BACL|nr:hypothetical protein [Paenibacillus allorhizosphaerae]CAG7651021.1 hypothetical protein PAECIP111802_04867 [Paenibacillus allorhizosphaerae]
MKLRTFGLTAFLLCTSLLMARPYPSAALQQPVLPTETKLAATGSVSPGIPDEIRSSSLSEAANRFIGVLSSQQGFEQWKQSTWTSYPLGPGTHGWVILVASSGRDIGYLVLYDAGPDKYRLAEYGNGEYPLFSMQTLYRSMVQLELFDYSYKTERLYYNPLQAVWKITVQGADREWYLDAKTGEELPFQDGSKLPKVETGTSPGTKPFTKTEPAHNIIEAGQTAPAEPNQRLPWVQGKPEAGMTERKLQEWIRSARKPVFSAELYSGSVILPLSVSGYHVWSGGDVYVKVLQDDDRYLPFETLASAGGFYP